MKSHTKRLMRRMRSHGWQRCDKGPRVAYAVPQWLKPVCEPCAADSHGEAIPKVLRAKHNVLCRHRAPNGKRLLAPVAQTEPSLEMVNLHKKLIRRDWG